MMTADLEYWHDSRVTLIDSMGSDARVVEAARVSTRGEGSRGQEPDAGLIRYLIRNNHWSPFEHPAASFLIETPLFTRAQIIRHKSFAFNEESARYREMRPRFYIPSDQRPLKQVGKPGAYTMVEYAEAADHTTTAMKANSIIAWHHYTELLSEGVAREIARSVLPQNLITAFYMTGNLRSWIHFLQARDDSHAQHEVRSVAQQIRRELETLFPLTLKEIK